MCLWYFVAKFVIKSSNKSRIRRKYFKVNHWANYPPSNRNFNIFCCCEKIVFFEPIESNVISISIFCLVVSFAEHRCQVISINQIAIQITLLSYKSNRSMTNNRIDELGNHITCTYLAVTSACISHRSCVMYNMIDNCFFMNILTFKRA